MNKPSIENIIKHNENIMEETLNGSLTHLNRNTKLHYRCKGWVEALNYIINNYNLEEK